MPRKSLSRLLKPMASNWTLQFLLQKKTKTMMHQRKMLAVIFLLCLVTFGTLFQVRLLFFPNLSNLTKNPIGNFPKLRVRFLCLFLIWTINSGSYYGLTLNVKNLGGNFYINLLINALMEIPAISLIIFAVAKFNIGRRKILIFSYLFCGILNLLVSLIQTNWIVDSSEGTGKYMEISLGKWCQNLPVILKTPEL